jgi:hypothetical protein
LSYNILLVIFGFAFAFLFFGLGLELDIYLSLDPFLIATLVFTGFDKAIFLVIALDLTLTLSLSWSISGFYFFVDLVAGILVVFTVL